jgi:hypothetical protein
MTQLQSPVRIWKMKMAFIVVLMKAMPARRGGDTEGGSGRPAVASAQSL